MRSQEPQRIPARTRKGVEPYSPPTRPRYYQLRRLDVSDQRVCTLTDTKDMRRWHIPLLQVERRIGELTISPASRLRPLQEGIVGARSDDVAVYRFHHVGTRGVCGKRQHLVERVQLELIVQRANTG